jgi:hypothetical protein
MSSLFAELFLVESLDPEGEQPAGTYDERRGLTVDADGRPLVVAASALQLGTETRQIPGEREDVDRGVDLGTHTAIRAEAEERAGTDDAAVWLALETVTKVRREGSDFDAGSPAPSPVRAPT